MSNSSSPVGPAIRTVSNYLKVAQPRFRIHGPTTSAAANATIGYGLRILAQVLEKTSDDLDAYEMAERAVIYDTLAGLVADRFDITQDDAFRALVELCPDELASQLVHGQPVPPLAHVELLQKQLGIVTVKYERGQDTRFSRVTEIVFRADGEKWPRVTEVIELTYEDIPRMARERLIYENKDAVRYQLYPQD